MEKQNGVRPDYIIENEGVRKLTDKLDMEVNRLKRCSKRHDIMSILGCDACKLCEEHKYKKCLDRFDNITVNYPDYIYLKEAKK